MPLETATYIDDLDPANPTSGDSAQQGDDHIRLIKATLKNTFPNISEAVLLDHELLNSLGEVSPNTIVGNNTENPSEPIHLDRTAVRNFLGLAGAAFQPESHFSAKGHTHADLYSPLGHGHPASQIHSGVLNPDRLPSASYSNRGAVARATYNDVVQANVLKYPDANVVHYYVEAVKGEPRATTEIPLTSATYLSAEHGFGKTPTHFSYYLEAIQNDGPYYAGERIQVPSSYVDDGRTYNFGVSVNYTSVIIRKQNEARIPYNDGGWNYMDPSKWKLVFHIYY